MVIRTEQRLIDDIDGSAGQVGTYRFALQGVEYEIDLSDGNWQKLSAALAQYTAAGRRLPKTKADRPAPTKRASTAVTRTGAKQIRRWWQEHQHTYGLPTYQTRGQVPRTVRDAYDSRH